MEKRFWYPFTFRARTARVYRVSFLIAEEATWDHRFHDLDGRELEAANLGLTRAELRAVQVSCDGTVGTGDMRVDAPRADRIATAHTAA